MQRERVRAHELRKKDEAELIAELTKFRVSIFLFSFKFIIERVSLVKSKQSVSCSLSKACQNKGMF